MLLFSLSRCGGRGGCFRIGILCVEESARHFRRAAKIELRSALPATGEASQPIADASRPRGLTSIDLACGKTIVSPDGWRKTRLQEIAVETMQHLKLGHARVGPVRCRCATATSLFATDAIAAKMAGDPAARAAT